MVWTVGADSKVVPTPLKMGNWIGKSWVVLSGLKQGEKVVVDNIIKIRPGAAVSPNVIPLEPVAAAQGASQATTAPKETK